MELDAAKATLEGLTPQARSDVISACKAEEVRPPKAPASHSARMPSFQKGWQPLYIGTSFLFLHDPCIIAKIKDFPVEPRLALPSRQQEYVVCFCVQQTPYQT